MYVPVSSRIEAGVWDPRLRRRCMCFESPLPFLFIAVCVAQPFLPKLSLRPLLTIEETWHLFLSNFERNRATNNSALYTCSQERFICLKSC